MSLLFRSSRRYLVRHPWQIGLSILGVAMAVAVVVGVDLANASATRAFRLSVEGVAGRATHEITAGPGGVDEALYVRLRRAGFRRAAPVVEGWVAAPARPRRPLRLFGVDPFAEDLFRTFTRSLEQGDSSGDLGRFLTEPGATLVSAELAAELEVAAGETFEVRHGGREHRLVLIGLLAPDTELARRSSRDLLVVDIAGAQEVLGGGGHLGRIDLVLEGDDEKRLRELLPPGTELAAKSARSGALDQMTRAFRLNLQALSLLALLVGMFLIYNTMTFSVVQRRPLIGALRAMGVTRREIFRLVLAEAALIAVVGSGLGTAAGMALARGLLGLVVQTINDLYFVLTVQAVETPLWGLAKGACLGLAGTLLATLAPAREATEAPPRAVLLRSQLERRARRALPRLTAAGGGFLLLAAALLAVPTKSLPIAFAAIFVFVLGVSCLVPPLTFVSMRLARPLMARLFGILGSLAARGVAATLSRTGVAVAALVVAVAMTVGVTIMVRSFRATLVDWLAVTLQADVYVSPVDTGGRGARRALDPGVEGRARSFPGVAYLTTYQRVEVASPRGPTQLVVLGIERPAFRVLSFAEGDRDDAWRRFTAGAVLISEPYAYHHDLEPGDRLELATDHGARSFEVAAIYTDYGSDRGAVTVHRRTYERFWDDRTVQSLGLFAADGVDGPALARALGEAVGDLQELRLTPNRELRRAALEIFDRTFAITAVLRLLAMTVAFLGILSALMALQLERARELGTLRANGMTPGQVWGLVTAQTSLTGLVAGLAAVPVGIALATLLIRIINRRSFGWTLHMELEPGVLLQAVLLAFVSALLAGLYPAWKMSRSSPALALREE